MPIVDGANGTNPNTLRVDPDRSRSNESMLVAPAIMPITTVNTLKAASISSSASFSNRRSSSGRLARHCA
ncbi:MAG: hypothetical protein R2704_12955 [Microthrixaceae bacterium]